jgi:hypothetical protein
MKYIKFSFYYIAGYLGFTAVGLIFVPELFQKFMFASEVYPSVPMQFAGMFALLLSIVVFQLARKGLWQLYLTTLLARTFGLVILMSLYVKTHNPFFLSALVVVSVGYFLTLVGHFKKT